MKADNQAYPPMGSLILPSSSLQTASQGQTQAGGKALTCKDAYHSMACQAVPCPHPGSEPENPGPPRSGTRNSIKNKDLLTGITTFLILCHVSHLFTSYWCPGIVRHSNNRQSKAALVLYLPTHPHAIQAPSHLRTEKHVTSAKIMKIRMDCLNIPRKKRKTS
nr:uncharacterized protein LOC123280402 [Equus asinus]XP_044613356.1 uncharacterized protein LOC123280402 [Equus asinus]XP_044613357.1 uncharacterized protein LOC123280402 [Equus asinus]XP_044613358.1 uncharacterized protein LOC123280402 [Equus asinus]